MKYLQIDHIGYANSICTANTIAHKSMNIRHSRKRSNISIVNKGQSNC